MANRPPLAFLGCRHRLRAAGNHAFGVYLLAQIRAVLTFRAVSAVGGLQVIADDGCRRLFGTQRADFGARAAPDQAG